MASRKLVAMPGNWDGVKYCKNDPVNFVDPSGYFSQPTWHMFNSMGVGQQVWNEMKTAGSTMVKALKYAGVTAGVIATDGVAIEVAPVVVPIVADASLKIGTIAALNPIKTTMSLGFIQGVLDKRFDLRTGIPNLDPLGAVSEEFGKFIVGEGMNIYNSFERNTFEGGSNYDFGVDNDGSNHYE